MKRIIEFELQDTPQIAAEIDFRGEVIRADDEALKKEYDSGYNDGYALGDHEGYEKGYGEGMSDGKDEELSTMWDNLQDYGNRKRYVYGFYGEGWNDNNFKPKYPIKPIIATQMFYDSKLVKSEYLKQIDFSESLSLTSLLTGSTIEEMGVIDCRKVMSGYGGMNSIFSLATKLRTVELFIPHTDASILFNNCFSSCTSLEDIRFGGEIVQNGLNLQWSEKLSVESAKDVIAHLKNYAGTENAFANSIVFNAKTWEALEASGAAPDGGKWRDYVMSQGWTPL